jgi:uncharacterized protein YwgA
MNRRQIALKLVLAELEVPATMDSFDDRLILQKAVYLAQQADISLGYHYYWYLRGPYCRELTADAYTTISETPGGWSLGDASKQKLAKIKQFFLKLKAKPDPVKAFELFASVLFAVKTGQAKADDGKHITQLMQAAGKSFSEGDVNEAIKCLREQGFLPAT